MAGSSTAALLAALLGLGTVAVLLAANVLELINYRDRDNITGTDAFVDINEGYIYFGIVGSSISGVFYILLLFVNKQRCYGFFYTVLESAMALQFALGTVEAI